MLFFTSRIVCTLHTVKNPGFTNLPFLYLYLQQNITHTLSITLSKAVQLQSKNYPHNYQHANINHNFQLIITIPISFITHQTFTLLAYFSTTHFFHNGTYRDIRPNILPQQPIFMALHHLATQPYWPRLSCHPISINNVVHIDTSDPTHWP